jgi:formylglycine-generating enzyme required for sulfatase activity
MATVGPGAYEPLFPPSPSETSIPVRAFLLDRVPVTNAEYLAFVRAEPSWRRDRIAPVLAEKGYLAHWQSEGALGAGVDPAQPVVSVSWFAARAYCAWRGARLPLEAEWELAAAASPTETDAKRDPAWRAELLSLYSRPSPPRLPLVGAGQPNAWGVKDMHGVVWEWVEDFDASVAASSSGSDRLRFCGATAGASSDPTDFAAFERVAFRSSLRGAFTTKNLGFRCARDLPKEGASSP